MIRGTLAAVFLVSLGIALTLGFQFLTGVGGPRFDTSDVEDLKDLRTIAFALSPAVNALDKIRTSGEAIPQSLTDVHGLPEGFLETFPTLHLSVQDGSYSLYYKLSWDGSLNFDETSRFWTFDPGDGSPITSLTKQVEQDEDPKPDNAAS